ncbi:MAG: c-type cytochrome, partial [Verrucomicrobia bacterium]|nr:c-type cytochrome [Verrucomicrobiota bacterium]
MNPKTFCLSMIMFGSLGAWGENDDFPVVPADFEVRVFAQEPLVRNPCAITFDAQGRLFVGMGPQYRRPTPEMEGDSVFILIDADQDGVADERKTFAKGLNSIQGMAWRGNQLWIANSPDLTVVKDLDGDDEADEYLRLFTDLGNIEHGLHGLNWAPDGKLYMSKGNSKGLNNAPDRIAPKAFRELWGMGAPEGTPDFPKPRQFTKATYKSTFHDPDDDWGLNGGILRCNPDGSGLEIVSRGLRNPWDIAFDSQFNWIGTDNDQNLGDKIFSPFYSANYGWGHPWSYDWLGDDHLPSAPSAGPLFEGSGTGVIFSDIDGYPEHYKGVYFINDWLNREIYIYRPDWKGAWMRPLDEMWSILASAGTGRTMESSAGRRFDPVDIEIGPDGAIYVSSWGRQYGSVLRGGSMVNEGRIYKLWPKSFDFVSQESPNDPFSTINPTMELLILHLGSHLPARRVDAQNALVRSGKIAIPALQRALLRAKEDSALETWLLWTLGRIGISDRSLDSFFQKQWEGTFNRRIQVLRIVAFQARERHTNRFPSYVVSGFRDDEARVRHALVLGLHQSKDTQWNEELLRLIQDEEDRLVYYSAWQAMRDLLTESQQKELLKNAQPSVRRAALLSLLEDDSLADNEIRMMTSDSDVMTAFLAQKRLGGKVVPVIKGPAISAQIGARVKLKNLKPLGDHSPVFALNVVQQLKAQSGNQYEQATLQVGTPAYTDRSYRFLDVPHELTGETFIRTANNDADFSKRAGMQFELMFPSTIFVADDMRGESVPNWLNRSFEATELFLKTDDAKHRLYKAQFQPGIVEFGSNKDGVHARKAGYIVIVKPEFLQVREAFTRVSDVVPLLGFGDAQRGRTLYHHMRAVNCSACHQLEGQGNAFAPDLKDIGNRATSEMIVRSILEPSAEITEGFVSQTIETKQG